VRVIQPFLLSIPWRDPLDALTCLGCERGVLGFIGGGAHPLARWSFLMDAPVQVHEWREGDKGQPFDGLQARLDRLGIVPEVSPEVDYGPFQGGWAGLLGYELGRAFEDLPLPIDERSSANKGWPDVWLGLYDTVAVFDAHQNRAFIVAWGLTENGPPDKWLAIEKANALAARLTAPSPTSVAPKGQGLSPTRSREDAQEAIARAVTYIHDGDIFQANISIGFEGVLATGDTPTALFTRLVSRHPSPFATYLSLGDMAVVSHSPERFLSRTPQGQLETRPIKGTMPRHPDPIKDNANAAILEASLKDRAENLMIVDLMRNDLSRVCIPGSVKVPRLCALESFSTVHHLVSDVIGQQKPGLGFFDALAASFPPGSITGAPKVRAMEIISELEGERRGPWCGSMIRVGFDGSADSSVLIRTAACASIGDIWHITARAGAGIVADSDPSLEYEEMLVKARALRVASKNDAEGCV
jgi:para-aminobenzoate synthetase component I